MVARRFLAALVALTAVLLAAGCAKKISGVGRLVPGAVASTPSASPAPSGAAPTTTDSTSTSPSAAPTGSGGFDRVCAALDSSAVASVFGSPVTLQNSLTTGCQISSGSGKSMIVAAFDALTLNQYKHGAFTNLTVDGHPAIRTDSNIIYVARSTDPAASGLLAAYYSGLGTGGDAIAAGILGQLVPKF